MPSCGCCWTCSSGRSVTSRPSASKLQRAPNLSCVIQPAAAALTANQPSPCGTRPAPPSTSGASLGTPDLRSEELVLAELCSTRLAIDGRDGRERRVAGRTAAQDLAAALCAARGHLVLEVVEPAQGGAASQTERDPVAEHLPTLLAQPVRGLAHFRRLP